MRTSGARLTWLSWVTDHRGSEKPSRLAGFLRSILPRFARTEDVIADRYAGCSWGDSTERRLLDDLVVGRRGPL